jgi:hypothetical protein
VRRSWPEAAILLLLVAIHIGTLSFPPRDHDVGGITYNGMLLNRGMVPYRDSFEQKFPMAFFIAGGIIALFGTSVAGFNFVALAWAAAHLAVLWWGANRLWGRGPARWVACAYVLASTASIVGGSPNYEHWMCMPVTVGLLIVLGSSQRSVLLIAAGASLAAGVLVKQQAVFSTIPLLVWAGCELRKSILIGTRRIALVAAGAAIPVVLILLYFGMNGELGNFLRMISPKGAMTYATGVGASRNLIWYIARQETTRIVHAMPLLYYAGTAFMLIIVQRVARRMRVSFEEGFLAVWIIGAVLGVVSGMRFFTHYYVQLIPILSLSVGWLANRFASSGPGATTRSITALLMGSILLWSSLGETVHHMRLAWWQTKYAVMGKRMPPTAEQRIAHAIRSRVLPEETIIVWGHVEDMYFLSDRMAPTRYYKYYAFMAPPPATYGPLTLNPAAREHSDRFLADIVEQPPAAVVISAGASDAPIDAFPQFETWLCVAYRRISVVDHLELWVKKIRTMGEETGNSSVHRSVESL